MFQTLCALPGGQVRGELRVPGDKSISHRAVLLAAVGESETRIAGFGRSEDTEATIKAVRDLGVRVYEADPETLRVFGVGLLFWTVGSMVGLGVLNQLRAGYNDRHG